jgi:pentatricopeptide repeat protein
LESGGETCDAATVALMSALLARYGLAESPCLLGRGNGQLLRRGLWNEQTRKASWSKKIYDSGLGSNQFGLGQDGAASKTSAEEEREAHKKMSNFLRGNGWGLGDPMPTNAGKQHAKDKILPLRYGDSSTDDPSESRRSETTRKHSKDRILPSRRRDSGADDLSWSQSSEDAYWDASSKSIDEEQYQNASPRTKAPADEDLDWLQRFEDPIWERNSSPAHASVQPSATDEHGLGWSQQSEDEFWERTSSSEDDPAELEQESSDRIFGSEVYGSAVPVQVDQNRKERSIRPKPLPYINYEVWLPLAIEDKDADKVAQCLYTAQTCLDYDFVNNISEATFTDILHVLDPRNNIDELSHTYMEISEHMAKQMGLMPVSRLMLEYSLLLKDIVTQRREGGHRLTSAQYSILLHCSQHLGDSRFAAQLWGEMRQDGIVPDIEMFNAYLGSFVWAGWNNSTARRRERVINVNMLARKRKRRDMPFANYHIGSPGGIKEKAMDVLGAMLNSGLTANEETYRSIITAVAREGEIDTVESILNTAWGIDVQSIMELTPGHADMPKAKVLSEDSQQYPTTKLLWTLAHAFSINNDIPKALRLVDYVSREYDLAIGQEAWSVLFEWTFAMATPRHGTNARDDRKTGQLPKASVQTLFDTMTAAPYFVKPTMSMYNRLITNMRLRRWSTAMPEVMKRAALLKVESKAEMAKAWRHLRKFVHQLEQGKRYLPPPTVVRRRYETAKVIDSRNRLWMKRWMQLFLDSIEDWHRRHEESQIYAHVHGFTYGTVPRMLLHWREFAGARVEYDLPTGVLEIDLQTQEDILKDAVHREKIWYARKEAVANTGLLVGDGLLDSFEGEPEEGELAGATTRRLKEARQHAVHENNLVEQEWLGLEGVVDEPFAPPSPEQSYPPRT